MKRDRVQSRFAKYKLAFLHFSGLVADSTPAVALD